MHIVAFSNHKGGVGKSTLVFNVGHELARAGRRVLLVDLDYQGSLTNMAGCAESPGHNITQIMLGGSLAMRNILVEVRPTLHLAPADVELASAEIALSGRIGRENVLRRALATIGDRFDVCILDCPPSLSVMTVNGLAAAQGVIVPLQPTPTDLRALDLFLATVNDVREQINAGLQLVGCALVFYDARYSLHAEATQALQDAGLPILGRIGRSVKVAEASGSHVPLSEFDAGNPQVTNILALTKAVKEWLDDQP